jgi:hypothetical protein
MAKPTAEQAFGPPPKPTAHQVFGPPPAKPAAQPSLWSRAVADVEGVASGAVKDFKNAVNPATLRARRAEGSRAVTKETQQGFIPSVKQRVGHAWNDQIMPGLDQIDRDFRSPLDQSKGAMRLPARIGKTALDVGSSVFGLPAAGITALIGNQAQALTGIHKDTVGNLLTPGIAGKTVGAGARIGSAAKAGLKGGFKGASKDVLGQRIAAGMQRDLKGPGLAGKVTAAAGRVYTGVRSLPSPSRASAAARDTALFIRKSRGTNQLEADAAARKIGKLARRFRSDGVEDHTAFYNAIENFSKHENAEGVGAYRKGTILTAGDRKLAKEYGLNNEDLAAVKTFRGVYQDVKEKIARVVEKNVGSVPGMVKDYYHHIWQEDADTVEAALAKSFTGSPKQGSSGFLRQRKYPTIADGIRAGLTPKYDPVQTTQIYLENASKLATTHETQAFLKGADGGPVHASWHRAGQQPEGWVPLQGAMTTRVPKPKGKPSGENPPRPEPGPKLLGGPGSETASGARLEAQTQRRIGGIEPPMMPENLRLEGGGGLPAKGNPQLGADARPLGIEDAAAKARNVTPGPEEAPKKPNGKPDERIDQELLYAKPEVARIYNNHISKPFNPDDGPLQAAGHYAYKVGVNDMIWKLGLSPYHAITTLVESMATNVSSGIMAASRGNLKTGLKRLAQTPVSAAAQFDRGNTIRKQLLGGKIATPFEDKVNKAIINSGVKLSMDRDYQGTAAKTFYDALKDGTFKKEFKRNLMEIAKGDGSTQVKSRLFAAGDLVANIMTSASGPLFQDIIPKIKLGALAHMVEDYMEAHPGATPRQIQEFAAKATDTTDNRFGEMSRDNMFWNKKVQQVLQATLVSPTFKIGSIREMGGGIHDLPESIRGLKTGEGVSPRTAYLVALPVVTGITGAIYTYMKTGQWPDSLKDVQGYRTGGTDPKSGTDERGVLPGNQKEMETGLNFTQPNSKGLTGYGYSALNDVAGSAIDLGMNQDFKYQHIYGAGAPDGALGEYAKNRLAPIQFENMTTPRKKGSNITTTDQLLLGMRPAPPFIQDLEGANRKAEQRAKKDKKTATKANAKYQNLLETPAKAGTAAPPKAEDVFGPAPPPKAEDVFGPEPGARMKPGAMAPGAAIRPEFKPVVEFISNMPGVKQITAENDSFHPASDVHGQGRAMDFTIKGGKGEAAAFASRLRQRLHAEGFTRVRVLDEYNSPSRNATGGHIHVQYS